jgi:hypothetical protein
MNTMKKLTGAAPSHGSPNFSKRYRESYRFYINKDVHFASEPFLKIKEMRPQRTNAHIPAAGSANSPNTNIISIDLVFVYLTPPRAALSNPHHRSAICASRTISATSRRIRPQA